MQTNTTALLSIIQFIVQMIYSFKHHQFSAAEDQFCKNVTYLYTHYMYIGCDDSTTAEDLKQPFEHQQVRLVHRQLAVVYHVDMSPTVIPANCPRTSGTVLDYCSCLLSHTQDAIYLECPDHQLPRPSQVLVPCLAKSIQNTPLGQ